MKYISLAFKWLVSSSTNADNYSLTIKGVGIAVLPTLMFIVGVTHLQLSQADITSVFDTTATIIQGFFALVSGVAILYGLVRKIYLTVLGRNDVINQM